MRKKNNRFLSLAALGTAAALTLGACAEGAEDEDTSTTEDDADDQDAGEQIGDGEEISIALHGGWPEGVAVTYIWKKALEEQGFEVEVGDEAEAGPNYAAMQGGDFDLNFDMWLPNTHKDYWEEYGDDLEQLGVWYDDAVLTIAVNEDAPIDSLDELADYADDFDNRIVGIEPGAGLMQVTEEDAMPTYGLEDMELIESSTPSMLAELEGATNADEDIVVTLWRPHWAYDEYPVRDLEDPEGAMGDAEEIHTVGRDGFADEFPEVADAIGEFELTDDQLFSLENIMFNEEEDDGEDPEGSVEKWLEDEENQEFFDSIFN